MAQFVFQPYGEQAFTYPYPVVSVARVFNASGALGMVAFDPKNRQWLFRRESDGALWSSFGKTRKAALEGALAPGAHYSASHPAAPGPNAKLEEIAKAEGIATLAVQHSDSADFHDLHVATIKRMLEAAYAAGYAAAKRG